LTVSMKLLGRECLLTPVWSHTGNSSKQNTYDLL
jgi:hypothetical protein